MNYNPFGKGGAGAPLRDGQGNVITNTKLQAKVNANMTPMQLRQQATPVPMYPTQAMEMSSNRNPPGGTSSISFSNGEANISGNASVRGIVQEHMAHRVGHGAHAKGTIHEGIGRPGPYEEGT